MDFGHRLRGAHAGGLSVAFERLCGRSDLPHDDITGFEHGDVAVLVVALHGQEPRAYQGLCPHQDIELSYGQLDGNVLTCSAHRYTFDVLTGDGIEPSHCRLASYPLHLEGEDVLIDIEGVEPFSNCD